MTTTPKRGEGNSAIEVAVVLEQRFDRTPDGRVWTPGPSSYPFWARYLEVFDRVRVVARIQDVSGVDSDWRLVSGPGVTFAPIPYYVGPQAYLRRWLVVQRALREALPADSAVIMRVSSVLGSSLAQRLRRDRRPYGLEVVTDPHDVFAPGAVMHPLRAFFRSCFVGRLKRECRDAVAISYVTQQALQRRYPGEPGVYSVACSDVELPDAAFAEGPRSSPRDSDPFVLIGVGSLQQRYKGFDVLVEAVARCWRQGLDLRLVILGDGRHKEEIRAQAEAEGVGERVDLVGWIASSEEVRNHLDQADLFIMPSRADGLPRALVEAMARGLPCLGTRVGGIPELLSEEDVVPANDVDTLANSIAAVLRSPARRAAMSARNWTKAKTEFHEEVLRTRRMEFHRAVRERTESWLARQQLSSPSRSVFPREGTLSGDDTSRAPEVRASHMTLYVTGASGFVGRHLLEALLVSCPDSRIVAVHRRDLEESALTDPRITWICRDIVSDDLREDLAGVDYVFHLAAYVSFDTDEETRAALESVNVLGTRRVAAASLEMGVKKFVYVSSIAAGEFAVGNDVVSEENGEAHSLYGKSKLRGEEELARVASGGLDHVVFRPTALFGEHHKGSVFDLVRVIKQGKYVQIGNGKNSTNFLYVKDFVNVVIQGTFSEITNETFVVNHPRHTLRELTDMIRSRLGQRHVGLYVPRRVGMVLGLAGDGVRKLSGVDLPISVRRVRAICRNTYYSPSKLFAREEFSETHGLEKGLSSTIDWFRSSGLL